MQSNCWLHVLALNALIDAASRLCFYNINIKLRACLSKSQVSHTRQMP